jgi:hypothetical protein
LQVSYHRLKAGYALPLPEYDIKTVPRANIRKRISHKARSHTLKWRYVKDADGDGGDDRKNSASNVADNTKTRPAGLEPATFGF